MVSNLTVIGSRRLVGLMVVAGVTLGVALAQAAGASAVSWELNGSPTAETVGVTSQGTLKFSDKHGGLFKEKLKLECAVTSEGSVGPGSADETTHWTPTGCVTKEGTCPSPAVTALNLPWHTELAVVEGRTRDLLSSGGSGAPGYKVTCSGAAEDKCTGSTSTAIENVSGGVNTVFGSGSAALSCTRGEASTGAIEGADLVENPAGGTLTAVEALAEAWRLDGSSLVSQREARSSGTLTFVDNHGGFFGELIKIECSVNGEGAVGPEIAGEVSKLTATGCITLAGSCATPSITALHLPWETELVPIAGAKRNLITSGSGPEYEVACAGVYSYTCSWNASTAMSNVSEGVDATFADEKRACTRGTGSTITGTELIKEPAGHKLSV